MGEPTIYKPSIYKGNGIYKNGAGGGGGGGEYIEDNFFFLKNGIYDTGMTPTSGDFGALQEENDGYIENGTTPYFSRENFTANRIDYLSNDLKNFFQNNSEWTIDFWLKYGAGSVGNGNIFMLYNNNDVSDTRFKCGITGESYIDTIVQGSSQNVSKPINFWHHVALVKYGTSTTRANLFIDGQKFIGGEATSQDFLGVNLMVIWRGSTPYKGVCISQIAIRPRAVWKDVSQFFVPRKLYKQI